MASFIAVSQQKLLDFYLRCQSIKLVWNCPDHPLEKRTNNKKENQIFNILLLCVMHIFHTCTYIDELKKYFWKGDIRNDRFINPYT